MQQPRYDEFVIELGYKAGYIKKYMNDYAHLEGDLLVRTGTGEAVRSVCRTPDWSIDLVETGLDTNTGGRIKRL